MGCELEMTMATKHSKPKENSLNRSSTPRVSVAPTRAALTSELFLYMNKESYCYLCSESRIKGKGEREKEGIREKEWS